MIAHAQYIGSAAGLLLAVAVVFALITTVGPVPHLAALCLGGGMTIAGGFLGVIVAERFD